MASVKVVTGKRMLKRVPASYFTVGLQVHLSTETRIQGRLG